MRERPVHLHRTGKTINDPDRVAAELAGNVILRGASTRNQPGALVVKVRPAAGGAKGRTHAAVVDPLTDTISVACRKGTNRATDSDDWRVVSSTQPLTCLRAPCADLWGEKGKGLQ